jgi:Ca2+-binding RTX toxin-like protein
MKNLFLLFGLLIICASIQAQKQTREYVLKTDLFRQHVRSDTTKEFPDWNASKKDSTLITISSDSLIIIANEGKDSYKLKEILDRADGIDLSDGDKWDGISWIAYDNIGIKVKLIVMKYKSGTILITITYGNVEYRYQCRPYKKKYEQMI